MAGDPAIPTADLRQAAWDVARMYLEPQARDVGGLTQDAGVNMDTWLMRARAQRDLNDKGA